MRIQVRFFAGAREAVGSTVGEQTMTEGIRLEDLAAAVFEEYPALRGMRLRFAVNSAYAAPGTILHDGDEVACIPPVGGG